MENELSPGAVATSSTSSSSASGRRSFPLQPRMNDRPPQPSTRSWAVWTSRYGWLPMVDAIGVGPAWSPAVSRSTSSAAPLWL